MSMKTAEAPRAIYRRNGVTHVLFSGSTFGPIPGTESAIKLDGTPVTITLNPADEGQPVTATVTQRKPKKKGIKEVWGLVEVPTHPRAPKADKAS